MMRKFLFLCCLVAFISLLLPTTVGGGFQSGNTIQRAEIKGLVFANGGIVQQLTPASPGYTANFGTNGVGTFGWEFTNTSGAALQNARLLVFLDADVNRENNTFFNEYGAFIGLALPPGAPAGAKPAARWEIDEPGFLFGNILKNFATGQLENHNGVPTDTPSDVSLALEYDLGTLLPNSKTVATFFINSSNIGGLSQTDPDANVQFFFNGFTETTVPPTNTPPTITASAALTRQQGSPEVVSTLATVMDTETLASNLLVEVISVPAGITLTKLTNTNGTITASIQANCTILGTNVIQVRVKDAEEATATANVPINVTANTPPVLAYPSTVTVVNLGQVVTLPPVLGPGDNGGLPAIVVQNTGGYTGSLSVNAAGIVTITGAAPTAKPFLLTIRATDNCNLPTEATFTVLVNGPPVMAGATLTRQQGSGGTTATIATVNDDLTAAGTLTVELATPAPGINLSGIANQNGTITANVAADCNAPLGESLIGLRVRDQYGLTALTNLKVNITTDTAPTLGTYPSAGTVSVGSSLTVTPEAAPTDNGSVVGIKATAPGFQGEALVNPVTGLVSLLNVGPPGEYSITLTATDNCGKTASKSFGLVVRNVGSACEPARFETTNTPATGTNPSVIVAGDFNGDGQPDLAVTNQEAHTVTALRGDGTGGYTPFTGSPIAVGLNPSSLAVGDFNADGKPDLAVANRGSNSVVILLGSGAGGFNIASGSPTITGNQPGFLLARDLNQDGKQDLAVANTGANHITILLGKGDGDFTPTTTSPLSVGTSPSAIATGDFNGDSKPDLAVTNAGSNNVAILLGDGTGAFNSLPGLLTLDGEQPRSLVCGDFNRDGRLDLVTANTTSNQLTILLGDGTGGFSRAAFSPLATGLQPVKVAAGDVNGDGRLDLITANAGSNNLSLWLGNAGGGFSAAPASPLSAGERPVDVVVQDLNLDRKQDLAVANFNAHKVSLLLNRCNTPPTIAAGLPLTLKQGAAGITATIAMVSDAETPAGELLVTATAPAGISVTTITNANGTITAKVAASCVAKLGTHVIGLTVTDSGGATATASLQANVTPSNPPTLTVIPNPLMLWPPDHQYETVRVTDLVSSVSDDCDSLNATNIVITQVSSDEREDDPTSGDGDTLNDIVIASDCRSVQLRAERDQDGNGRVYTIHLKVQDSSGNAITAQAKVHVPKSQGASGEPVVDDGPRYVVTSNCR